MFSGGGARSGARRVRQAMDVLIPVSTIVAYLVIKEQKRAAVAQPNVEASETRNT